MTPLGRPRVHRRSTRSTNADLIELAASGAPHGTLVTAGMQTAGRGRQGRIWCAASGRALLMSVLVREADELLPLRAGLAVARAVGAEARVKWPNDVLVHGRKVAGVLAEAAPDRSWTVVGVGVNVALREHELPATGGLPAGTLGRRPEDVDALLAVLLTELGRALREPPDALVAGLRRRDALLGLPVRWHGGRGTGAGIDASGRLCVAMPSGERRLVAGEVHLLPA